MYLCVCVCVERERESVVLGMYEQDLLPKIASLPSVCW